MSMSAVMESYSGEILQSSDFQRVSSMSKFAFGGEVSYTSSSATHEVSLMFFGPTEEQLDIFVNLALL